jgi:putative transposase
MPHTYSICLIHYVFSTKDRLPLINPRIQEPLWACIVHIGTEHKLRVLAVGGTEDHVHILTDLPPILSVAKAVQLIKGGSSRWINQQFGCESQFAWQEGYGAFSVGRSQVPDTVAYIKRQEVHHSRWDFQDEYRSFLDRNAIQFDAPVDGDNPGSGA